MRVDAATSRPGRAGRGLLVTAAPPPGTTKRARTGMNRSSCRGERPASATRPKLRLLRNARVMHSIHLGARSTAEIVPRQGRNRKEEVNEGYGMHGQYASTLRVRGDAHGAAVGVDSG